MRAQLNMRGSARTPAWFLGLLWLVGCSGGSGDPAMGVLESRVSECGGFGDRMIAVSDYEGAYCDAEVLHWQYDESARRLAILDARAILNCCGERSVWATIEGATIRVLESDAPDPDQGRCRCSCVFDQSITLENVPQMLVHLQLVRDLTDDDSEAQVLFEDDLDLSLGSGCEVIDETDASGICP